MSEKNQKKNQKSEAKTPLTEVSQSMVDYVQPVIDAITENKPCLLYTSDAADE